MNENNVFFFFKRQKLSQNKKENCLKAKSCETFLVSFFKIYFGGYCGLDEKDQLKFN